MDLLHDCRNPLQPHAGIDRWPGQRVQRTRAVPVVLHEYQVPDFNIAVAIRLGRTGRAAGNFGAVVIKNLGTGTARPGIAHLPEVVHGGDARQPGRVDPNLVDPDIRRFVILGIYGYP